MIDKNLENIKERIESSCKKVGRNPQTITLVGITKTVSPEIINIAYSLGLRHFGENKVQELISKIDKLPKDIHWHFVGHLQRNKVKYIADFIHLIHSVDSYELALEIDKQAKKCKKQIPVLIQVNTSNEESKYGVEPEMTLSITKQIAELENIKIVGLMTIGALYNDPEMVRPCFKSLKNIFDKIKMLNLKNVEMKELSMGMTNDFEIAIEEGATIIRIGTAIFGKRDYTNK